MGVFDVSASALIKVVAADLKKQGLKQPEWVMFVKTGSHRERAPDSPEWFYERAASVLYRIYKEGPLGTGSLRSYYGGKKRRGVKKAHFRKAGGKIIRVCLQELEKQGLIKKDKKGRSITGKGQSYLNKLAKETIAFTKQDETKKIAAKAEKEKHSEKTEEEKKVEEELKKQEQVGKNKEKAKEEAKKKEKKKEEKKAEAKAE